MNMKKIAILALSLCMIAAIAVTGTIAYFTDTDNETNVFTIGKVDIDLVEVFDPNNAKLIPGKDIQKEVKVTNLNGSENAYVRVHIAVPTMLDSGDPEFAAYKNTLHWNFSGASLADGLWNWNVSKDGPNYPGNGGTWNAYETTVDGVEYNVYVATYETALAAGATTADNAIEKVYLDTKIDDEGLAEIQTELGAIKILVFAEGGQEEGFEDAYTALNTQFGTPTADGYVDPWNK